MSERGLFSPAAAPLALFALIGASAFAAIESSRIDVHVAAFWPVNGIALVALLRLRRHVGSRMLSGLTIPAALFLANVFAGVAATEAAWFTLANCIEIAVAYAILRVRPPKTSIDRGPFVSLLPGVLSAAVIAPACGALLVVMGLSLQGVPPWPLWREWWLPGTLGILTVVPLGLSVSLDDIAKLREPHNLRRALLILAALAAAIIAVGVTRLLAPMLFVAPLMMIAAVRFRALGAAVVVGVALWSIIPLAAGAEIMRNAVILDPMHRQMMVQSFLSLIALLALGVSAVLDERDALARALDGRRRVAADAAQARLRLLMNVAHEIRTPLNVIQGCGEMAVSAGPLNARQKDLLGAINAASRQLQVLASDLLEAARLEHGAIALAPERFNPHEQVSAAIADVRASLSWDGPMLFSSAVSSMWADPQRFRQVATNLISNAVKFGGAYGPVRIGLKEGADAVWFSVSDCGPGFPPGHEHEVFEPFAASCAKVTPASAGVGLSLVKQLVEAHGGQVRCVSTPYIETRIETLFPSENAPGAAAQLTANAQLRSVDPDSVF